MLLLCVVVVVMSDRYAYPFDRFPGWTERDIPWLGVYLRDNFPLLGTGDGGDTVYMALMVGLGCLLKYDSYPAGCRDILHGLSEDYFEYCALADRLLRNDSGESPAYSWAWSDPIHALRMECYDAASEYVRELRNGGGFGSLAPVNVFEGYMAAVHWLECAVHVSECELDDFELGLNTLLESSL